MRIVSAVAPVSASQRLRRTPMTATILVGYDGTDHGDDALALGRLLAGLAGAQLVVACAYPEDPLGESAAALEVARELREEAEGKLSRARTRLGGADADLRAVAGASPSHVLHELAEELGAEAIVVGATHHGRALRLLTGSTPESVLDHAPCAVAVAPDGYRDAVPGAAGGVRQVAVAYDGSPEAEHALALAARYAHGADARLRLVMAVNSAAAGVYPPPPLDVVAYEELGQLARDEARGRLDAAIA